MPNCCWSPRVSSRTSNWQVTRHGMEGYRELTQISVVGLGKLGAPLVAVLASKGFEVVGVDRVPLRVSALRAGRAPVMEPGLQDLLTRSLGRIDATTEIKSAI